MGDETWMEREAQRQELVRKAVEAIDQLILDASDGTEEKTNKLTGEVFEALVMTRDGHSIFCIRAAISILIVEVVETVDRLLGENGAIKDYLWMQVVQKFAEKVMCPYAARLQKWDMEHPAENNWPNSARDPHPQQ